MNPDTERFTIGPDGERLTLADLPGSDTRYWVARRKARVVAAVRGGLVTRDEVMVRYGISDEEFEQWASRMSAFGLRGLCVTRIDQRRTSFL